MILCPQYSSNYDERNRVPSFDTRVPGEPRTVKMRSRALMAAVVFANGSDITSGHLECESINIKYATPSVGSAKSTCSYSMVSSYQLISKESTIHDDLSQWNRSNKSSFNGEDYHFVSTNFMIFLMTGSFAEARFISTAVTGIFQMQYTSFSRDMHRFKTEGNRLVTFRSPAFISLIFFINRFTEIILVIFISLSDLFQPGFQFCQLSHR
ncbi:unnamed protein product [Hymenolepis diminuta]|uniref:Uncharacterized protein n=1 Tax=Hymenolepis diminuta TaxID=6216 RepID=A0A564YR65_HYMDI|nr:unnamed protein product [Hymenolepis diminuta]